MPDNCRLKIEDCRLVEVDALSRFHKKDLNHSFTSFQSTIINI